MNNNIDNNTDNKIQIEVERFLEYCLKEKDRSVETTIKQYKTDIYEFLNIIEFDYGKTIDTITMQDIDRYISVLHARKYSSATYNKKISTLKSFYNYLEKRDYIIQNLMRKYDTRKIQTQAKNKRSLSDSELERLLDNCKTPRNKMIIQLLAYSGMRVSELIKLKLKDIMWESEVLRVVNGKGGKDRIIPMNENLKLLEYLKDYIENIRNKKIIEFNLNNKVYPYVFISNNGTQLAEKNINYMLKAECKAVKIENFDEIHPHTMRHTFATNCIREGMGIETLAQIMGHSDISTTSGYAVINEEDMKKAVNKCWIKKENK